MSSREKILRIYNDTDTLNFVVRFPKGKSINTIDDVIFLVKQNDSDPMSLVLIEKYLSQGQITLHNKDIVRVYLTLEDYDGLKVDVLYRAALFCKWQNASDFDENVEHLFDFQLEQNFHNDN